MWEISLIAFKNYSKNSVKTEQHNTVFGGKLQHLLSFNR